MNKKFAAIIVFGLTMTTCASPAAGQDAKVITYTQESASGNLVVSLQQQKIAQTKLELEMARLQEIEDNKVLVTKAIKKLTSYTGKTWYVFSGSTPRGWDCSGMTLWFYEQLGISLEHRASVQDDAGTATNSPMPGDLVTFKYNNSKEAYHVGIYIGNGEMIHAPAVGQVTRIESVDSFAGNYSKVSYRNLITTN